MQLWPSQSIWLAKSKLVNLQSARQCTLTDLCESIKAKHPHNPSGYVCCGANRHLFVCQGRLDANQMAGSGSEKMYSRAPELTSQQLHEEGGCLFDTKNPTRDPHQDNNGLFLLGAVKLSKPVQHSTA